VALSERAKTRFRSADAPPVLRHHPRHQLHAEADILAPRLGEKGARVTHADPRGRLEPTEDTPNTPPLVSGFNFTQPNLGGNRLVAATRVGAPSREVPREGATARERVLVAEERGARRRRIADRLRALGFSVTEAGGTRQALDELGAADHAAVLCPLQSSSVDGRAIIDFVRGRSPDTQVVLTAARPSIAAAVDAVRLGAADFLVRPDSHLDELEASLDRVVAAHRRAHAARREALLARAATERLAHVTDHLPVGVLLVDRNGLVLTTNSVARRLLGAADGLRLTPSGELRAAHASDTAELLGLLARACAPSKATRCSGTLSVGRSACAPPLAVLVCPLPGGGMSDEITGAAAALFVSDPCRRVRAATSTLCGIYGLTRAEAGVVSALIRFGSIGDAAAELGISKQTARTHLKRVFSKTSTRKQGDLISLALSGPALVRVDDDDDDDNQ